MKLMEFQEFVKSHREWLTGPIKVPLDQIKAAEQELNLRFPPEIGWLLCNYGIWNGTGVQALQWIVASTKRLATKNILVLARTSVSQFDDWQDQSDIISSQKTSGYVVLEVKSDGSSGKVIWLRECLHENLLDAIENKQLAQMVFNDFCHFIKQRVEKLEAAGINRYLACPHQKLLPESPLVVEKNCFPWEHFMMRLGETISWNIVRKNYALELPDEFKHGEAPQWIEQIVYTQEARRHMLLTGGFKADSYYAMIGSSCRPIIKPAENLAGGDLLLTNIGVSEYLKSQENELLPAKNRLKPHLFDTSGRPAPDYWVSQLLLRDLEKSGENDSSEDSSNQHYLVCWIPPGLYPHADQELKKRGDKNSIWLEQAPENLVKHFKDRQLISK